jgi:hypothetical protein
MSFRSSQDIKENPRGPRMSEGWNSCTNKGVNYIESKKGPTLIFEWVNTRGEIVSDFIGETDSFGSHARLKALSEIAGVDWEEGASGDDIAQMFNASLLKMDVEVVHGKGDGAFVKSYRAYGGQDIEPDVVEPKQAPVSKPIDKSRW